MLRKKYPALGTRGSINFLYAKANNYPLVYERVSDNQRFIVVVNPSGKSCSLNINYSSKYKTTIPVLVNRCAVNIHKDSLKIDIDKTSYGVFEIVN